MTLTSAISINSNTLHQFQIRALNSDEIIDATSFLKNLKAKKFLL